MGIHTYLDLASITQHNTVQANPEEFLTRAIFNPHLQ